MKLDVCFQSHWIMNVNRNVQLLILPIVRQDYVDEFLFKLNSFRSRIILCRAIYTTWNRITHIAIFQAFIETEYILESKFVTFFSCVIIIILDLTVMDKINLTVFHTTVW